MMMQCPRCSTRWRVAAASPVENPLFKCGRCHHLFRQFPGATPPTEAAPSERRAAAAAAPDTMEFIFPERQSAELLVADPPPAPEPPSVIERAAAPALASRDAVIVRTPLEAEETAIVAQAGMLANAAADVAEADDDHDEIDDVRAHADGRDRDQDHELGIDDDLATDGLAEHHGTRHELGSDVLAEPAADDELTLDDLGDGPDDLHEDDDEEVDDLDELIDEQPTGAKDTRRVVRVEETMKVPAGFNTIIRALGVAVSGFAALALVVRVAPEQTAAWLSKIPVAGAGFAHDRNLTTKVELKNVQGRFQQLRNARRVFVISGDARNNSPMTIERIEVAGALYGLGGGELDQKVVATGNRTTLTDLSEAEIALLQRLDPVIALAPGETTPFLIVFLEPPRELREFSSRVLSVRPTRRASTPPLRPGLPGSVG
ncbi:MAG: DUF3426 domain-containing protein [Candidatus Binatia bacterium]